MTVEPDLTIAPGPPKASPPRCLAHRIGFLLARGHIEALALAAEVLEPGLSGKHFGCMSVIAHDGPLSQQSLGDQLRVDRTTIVAIVDELERRGFVARRRNPEDRRAYALEATAAGRRWVERTGRALRTVDERLLEPLDEAESDELYRLLQKLVYGEEVEPASAGRA